MKDLIYTACYWMHLIATVTWIGGIFFILFVAIPSSRQVLGAEAGKLMGEISKRFTPLANISIALLIITGVVLAVPYKQFSDIRGLMSGWPLDLFLKHVLVFVMVVIHFYRGRILAPKITRASSEADKVALQKLSIGLVMVNFALGLLALLLSADLSVRRL